MKKVLFSSVAVLSLALAGGVVAEAAYQSDYDKDGVVEWVYDGSGAVLADGFYNGADLRGSGLAATKEITTATAVMVDQVDPTMYADDAPVVKTPTADEITTYTLQYEVVDGVLTDNVKEINGTVTQKKQDGLRLIPAANAPQRPVTGDQEHINNESNAEADKGLITDEINNPKRVEDLNYGNVKSPMQGDKSISGHYTGSTAKVVEIRKNNEVIGTAKISESGDWKVELPEGVVVYGNEYEVYYLDANLTEEGMDYLSVDMIATEHTKAPIRIVSDTDQVYASKKIHGVARPFDKVTLIVKDSAGLVVANNIVTYADQNGLWSYDLGENLAQKGNKVEVVTEDAAGNQTKAISLKVGDDSKVKAAIVRRMFKNDQSVTVQTEPYAEVELTVGHVTIKGIADGNGVARLDLLGYELKAGEKVFVKTSVMGRTDGTARTTVYDLVDNVKPEVPKVEAIVEGGTIIQGTAEAWTMVEAKYRDPKTTDWTILYTLADAEGKFVFDLLDFGVKPIKKGQHVYVASLDNARNASQAEVLAVGAESVKEGTWFPIGIDPDSKNPVGDQPDPNLPKPENGEKTEEHAVKLAQAYAGQTVVTGTTTPGSKVAVTVADPKTASLVAVASAAETVEVTADEKGNFSATVAALKEGQVITAVSNFEGKVAEDSVVVKAAEEAGKEVKGDKASKDSKDSKKAKLPETGETSSFAIYGAAILSVLAGLGFVAPKANKEN